ncbi:MAG TPA: OmpA family protein [Vicinamibacterales bacterium]|jgi:outer membrane protein OmpA-like peptidoglycan-associated protein|nr:OmpA family protein [Vicinamibacterales bacterium]
MSKTLIAASLLSLAVAMTPACATKKYVRTEVGGVNSKVDTLSGTLEQTQGRIQQDEARIGQVDQKAEAAGKSAEAAQNSANQAQNAASAAQQAARQVDTKVDRVSQDLIAGRKLVYEVTLSEDQGNFRFGKTDLPDEAKSRIDQMVGQLKGEAGKDIYIEVEGHTDNVGGKELNYQLGMERAEAVKKYLYAQHQIPLHKINVVSYGEDKPVAPNNTKDGRAMNRRVVIRVLS